MGIVLLAGACGPCEDCIPGLDQAETAELVADLKGFEGFRGDVYADAAGHPTIGYGTALPLSEAEG